MDGASDARMHLGSLSLCGPFLLRSILNSLTYNWGTMRLLTKETVNAFEISLRANVDEVSRITVVLTNTLDMKFPRSHWICKRMRSYNLHAFETREVEYKLAARHLAGK